MKEHYSGVWKISCECDLFGKQTEFVLLSSHLPSDQLVQIPEQKSILVKAQILQ
jgi:hypothetical protein